MAGYTIVRRNIFSINGKLETVYNQRNAPSPATDAIGLQYSSAVPPQCITEGLDYDGSTGDNANGLGPNNMVAPSGRSSQLPISMYFRGYGSAYSAPHVAPNGFHALLQASGLTATGSFGVGVEKYTYSVTPDSTTPASMSFDVNDGQIDGTSNYRQYQSLGTMFSMKFDVSGAKPCLFTFDGKGTYPVNPSEQAFTVPTLVNTPGIMGSSGITLSLGGAALKVYTASFDQGRTFNPRNPLSSAIAHEGWCAAGMVPKLKVTVEKQTIAAFDPWALRQSMATGAMIFNYSPGTQYNRFTLNGPQTQVASVKDSTHGNIGCYDLELLLCPSIPTLNDFLTFVTD